MALVRSNKVFLTCFRAFQVEDSVTFHKLNFFLWIGVRIRHKSTACAGWPVKSKDCFAFLCCLEECVIVSNRVAVGEFQMARTLIVDRYVIYVDPVLKIGTMG